MTRRPTPRFATSRIVAAHFALILLVATACSSRPSGDGQKGDQEPIAECDAFLSAYENCLASLGPANVARTRVGQTRASFASLRAGGDTARDALRKRCSDNLSQLKTTCR